MSHFVLPTCGFMIMGIVNVTPDSFSDGGLYERVESAVTHGLRLRGEGAHILDIGGESTRPGAVAVTPEEEIRRVVPVIQGLKGCGIPLSIDTRNASTMAAALDAGVDIVNDISALTHDPLSLRLVAIRNCGICLMHSQGTPDMMQIDPRYNNVIDDVYHYLEGRIMTCVRAGIGTERLLIDPGIGFGKTLYDNVNIVRNIVVFERLGVPLMLGASRKSFIEKIDKAAVSGRRLPGSIASVLAAYSKGVRHFRVHDVAETVQALKVYKTMLDNV